MQRLQSPTQRSLRLPSAHIRSPSSLSQHLSVSNRLSRSAPSRTLGIVNAASTAQKTERVQLGNSGVEVDTIAIGAWSWNDRSGYWGQNSFGNYTDNDLREAFQSLADNNLTFIDTAEVYGFGKSEELIGELRGKHSNYKPFIATKVAPLPWRFANTNVLGALRGSLSRLQANSTGLYQLHWPGFPIINNWATNRFVEGLADAQNKGLTQAVGVSNFKADRVKQANKVMQGKGVNLATNQVQYSLLYREPEQNGVIEACKETNTALLAYSPLTQGLLTGKYTLENKPGGPREAAFNDDKIRSIQPLLEDMREIGKAHGGKSCAQVAANWVISKGEQNGFTAIPIVGVKNKKQAEEAKGIQGWRLTEDEVKRLDRVSQPLQKESLGAPFEQW